MPCSAKLGIERSEGKDVGVEGREMDDGGIADDGAGGSDGGEADIDGTSVEGLVGRNMSMMIDDRKLGIWRRRGRSTMEGRREGKDGIGKGWVYM